MKKIILFYGSFDPIHNGHLKIASDALKAINGDKLYFGINKNSNSKNLTAFSKRKKIYFRLPSRTTQICFAIN